MHKSTMDHVNNVYQAINKIHNDGDFLPNVPDENYFVNSLPAFQDCDLIPSEYEKNNAQVLQKNAVLDYNTSFPPVKTLAYEAPCGGLPPVRPPSLDTARGLLKAAESMTGRRPHTHGDRFASFKAIADAITFYLKNRKDPTGDVRPHDVAAIFLRVKEIRAEYGEPIEDHFIDLIAYAAIEGE